VVNETFARRYWPAGEALTGRISLRTSDDLREGEASQWLDVVGVSADYKIRTIGEEPRPSVHVLDRELMIPFWNVVVRSDEPRLALDMLRREVRAMDPNLAIFDARTMPEFMGIALFPVRFGAAMLGTFGVLALGLAAIGLYGVIAYAVSRRTHEIGVRMALGAERRGVLAMVVRQGMKLALVGAAIGLGLATVLSSALSGLLYGITVLDPAAFLGAAGVLLLVAVIANLLPARRASRVDPIQALRVE
jgi:ABC-type antimicrobial peptide transport system permease subunit